MFDCFISTKIEGIYLKVRIRRRWD